MGQVIISGGAGGGVTSDEVTTTAGYVVKGKTYVGADTNDEIGTGTLELTGNLAVANALKGSTFYTTDPLTKLTGTLPNLSTETTIDYTVDNSTPVIAADNFFIADNSDGIKRICLRYTGTNGLIQNNTLIGYPASTFGDATTAYVYSGKKFTSANGLCLTGTMTCSSILSFKVAAYSTSQVICSWTNPAKGPYSGVIICAQTGSYPANKDTNRKYTGVGSSSAANATSSVTISGLTAGTTYYFRIWAYTTCSAGNFYSGYSQMTCKTTASGRKAFTSSGTWTVPANVRTINIHCTGGGGSGHTGQADSAYYKAAGGGGGGGYTAYKKNIAVEPGNIVTCVVGAGGTNPRPSSTSKEKTGGDTTVTINNTVGTSITASGGYTAYSSTGTGGEGGSAGGNGADFEPNSQDPPTSGYSNGNGNGNAPGQGTNTYEFGDSSKTLYSGGGGGAGGFEYYSGSESYRQYAGTSGGNGGGGKGAGDSGTNYNDSVKHNFTAGSNGSAGTGGGGGGGAFGIESLRSGYNGGSGNVIITW